MARLTLSEELNVQDICKQVSWAESEHLISRCLRTIKSTAGFIGGIDITQYFIKEPPWVDCSPENYRNISNLIADYFIKINPNNIILGSSALAFLTLSSKYCFEREIFSIFWHLGKIGDISIYSEYSGVLDKDEFLYKDPKSNNWVLGQFVGLKCVD